VRGEGVVSTMLVVLAMAGLGALMRLVYVAYVR
jgi:hypothetical protein